VACASSSGVRVSPWLRVGPHFERYGLVGRSPALAEVIERVERVSATRSTVVITGETGTGKELVAHAIHQRSHQRQMPFVKVNCAAIPETRGFSNSSDKELDPMRRLTGAR
jgi:transcriptional regulator with GAF, ATPase, and Fis domain